MKRVIKSLNQRMMITAMALAASVCVAALVFACKDDNNNGKTEDKNAVFDMFEIHSGLNKIKLKWKITDPNVASTIVYWSKRSETRTVQVTQAEWQELLLEDMEEDVYYFEFVMQDKSGNLSDPIEIQGAAYGDKYIESLPIRGASLEKLANGSVEVTWEPIGSATLKHSVIEYLDGSTPANKEVPNSESQTTLPSTSSTIAIYAVHEPLGGLDQFNSNKRRIFMPKNPALLDKSLFEPFFLPGDNTTPQPGNRDDAWKDPLPVDIDHRDIRALWDGNIRNNPLPGGTARGIFHTENQSGQLENARFKFPHCFTFSIGTMAYITDIKMHARGDNNPFTEHVPRFWEIWVTDNPKSRADFGNDDEFEQYYRVTYANFRAPDEQIRTQPDGGAITGLEFIATPPEGIYNWQEDWVRLGDLENAKPSELPHNQHNDSDRAVWGHGNDDLDLTTCGFLFELEDIDTKVKYIRLVIKYPNWHHTNCINIGEITLWGEY